MEEDFIMDNFSEEFWNFVIERQEQGCKRLYQDKEYIKLEKQFDDALHDILGDSSEMKQKYSVFENIQGQLECKRVFQTYLQGARDTQQLMALLG